MTNASDQNAIVAELAEALGETELAPLAQLRRIVARCGTDKARAWLVETEQIEAAGGELLPDKSRQRTKGGVYFKVVRRAVSPQDRRYIFPQFGKGGTGAAPMAASPSAPALPSATWADRGELMSEAQQAPGRANTVKITVIGRPAKTVERQGFTLLVLEHEGKLAALPKGIPVPPQPLPTQYIVYIGSKQWGKVKASLMSPDDVLIAEGVPLLDPKYNAITVFVTNATTKLLQQAQRATQPSQP